MLRKSPQALRRVATEDLARVEDDLQREAREDAELRQQYGRTWARPASAALNSTLLEKVAGAPQAAALPAPALQGAPRVPLGSALPSLERVLVLALCSPACTRASLPWCRLGCQSALPAWEVSWDCPSGQG